MSKKITIEERMAHADLWWDHMDKERMLTLRTLFDINDAVCNTVDEEKLRSRIRNSIKHWEQNTEEQP